MAPAQAGAFLGRRELLKTRWNRKPIATSLMISKSSRHCSARSWWTTGRWSASRALLKPEHFYDPLHARIFETMSSTMERGGMVLTPLTLHAAMKADPGLIEVGGTRLSRRGLAQAAPAMPNVRDYARILHDLAVRRSLIRIGEDIVNTAYEAPHRKAATGPDRGGRKGALCRRPRPSKYGEGAAGLSRGAAPGRGNAPKRPRPAAAGFPASPRASPISTGCWAACSPPIF